MSPIALDVGSILRPLHIILSLLCREQNWHNSQVKYYWEIIADNLSKAGWSWGCVSAIDSNGERSGLQTRIAMTER
jgi:hypothetical protein